jgi:hypothetical protein
MVFGLLHVNSHLRENAEVVVAHREGLKNGDLNCLFFAFAQPIERGR